jgi:carbonic anhydrase
MGHEDCGAIKAAIDQAKLGNITEMLANIKPAVESLSDYEGDQTSANPEFVHLVAKTNVRLTMADIRKRSGIIKGMENHGQLAIAGALYDMKTGAIEFID